MALRIYLAIKATNELNQNQNILELVEDYSIRSLFCLNSCMFSKNILQVLESCNSDTENSNSDQR